MTDEAPLLSAGEAARRIGVSVTTLRTWHQRYGLGPSSHRHGHHRRYTPDDMARLDTMSRLTAAGLPAADAARQALGQEPASAQRERSGGATIAVRRSGRSARGLARAAMRLDSPQMEDLVSTAVRDHGVVATWDELVRPVLAGLGDRPTGTEDLVDVEHLLSRTVSKVFAVVRSPRAARRPKVLLACADEEQHSLPLEALAAALAEQGCPVRLLGARTPTPALAQAVRRTGPVVVIVWSHTPQTAGPDQLRTLLDLRPPPVVIAAAGPGWVIDALPTGVEHPSSLADAIALTLHAIRASIT